MTPCLFSPGASQTSSSVVISHGIHQIGHLVHEASVFAFRPHIGHRLRRSSSEEILTVSEVEVMRAHREEASGRFSLCGIVHFVHLPQLCIALLDRAFVMDRILHSEYILSLSTFHLDAYCPRLAVGSFGLTSRAIMG